MRGPELIMALSHSDLFKDSHAAPSYLRGPHDCLAVPTVNFRLVQRQSCGPLIFEGAA